MGERADPRPRAAGAQARIGDFLILRALRESRGAGIAVSDDEMIQGVKDAAANEGLFMAPEGGACVAALRKLRASGHVSADESVVLFNTGTGYKYVDNMRPAGTARSRAGVTRLLYRDDPYLLEFDAPSWRAASTSGRPAVVLDQTAFYAESGGQPWDTGRLGGARVVAVVQDGDEVVHVLDRPLAGDRVRGHVDAARRRDHMQQHHGQHLLSRALRRGRAGARPRASTSARRSPPIDVTATSDDGGDPRRRDGAPTRSSGRPAGDACAR